MEGYLNLIKFLTDTLGIPGGIILAVCAGVFWMWKQERDDHKLTRLKVDEVNEKRVELFQLLIKTQQDFKTSLDAALAAIEDKGK